MSTLLPCERPLPAHRRARARFSVGHLLLFGASLALALLPGGDAWATTFTWSGGSPFSVDGNWTTPNNWVGQSVPVSAADTDLVFGATTSGGSARTTSNNNIADPFTLRTLTFTSSAPAYTLTGGALNLGSGGIVQNSANAHTINNSVTLGASQTWSFASGAGALNFGSDLNVSATGAAPTLTLNSGTLNLTNTGNAFVLGAGGGETGRLNLSGTASVSAQTIYVGLDGNATATQTGGSINTNVKSLYLAFRFTSTGDYNLSGANSTLTTSSTFVGYRGTGTFTQNGGTHTTGELSVGTIFSSANSQGTYNLNGGTLRTGSVATGTPGASGTSTFNFNGGTLQAGQNNATFFQGLTTANVQAGGAKIDTAGFNVTVAQALVHDSALGSGIADGGLVKQGNGTLTLTGTNTYTGGTTVSGGTLSVSSDANLGAAGGAVTLQNGGQLVFTSGFITTRTYNLNTSTMNFAGSLLQGATVNGGNLAGSAFLDGATLNNTTTLPGSSLGTNPTGATLNNVTVRGGLNVTAPTATVTFTNGFVTGSGTVTVGISNPPQGATYRINTSGAEIQGVTTINSGGTIANSGTSLYLTGGSRTTVNSGGTLSAASGSSIELNGSLLVNNGTQSGTLNVNFGSLAKGAGTFGTVNVGDGGRFSPGNSPGTATATSFTLASGGRYDFELNAANYTPGDGHADLLQVTGALNVNAGTTANSVFTIGVFSLNSANTFGGMLADFDASRPYSFLLMTAGSIAGFNANEFAVDTSGFLNNTQGGSFSVAQQGNNLVLQFSPVPEPSTWVMIGGGALILLGLTTRRRRQREV